MLTGPKLGAAIEAARKKKGVTKKALADEFGVSAPSVQDWVKRGTIDKDKLSRLWLFFQDVAGPDHWGLQNWTEDQHPSGGMLIHPVAQDSSPPRYHSGPIASSAVPVIGTLAMGEHLMYELRSEPDGHPIGTVHAPLSDGNSIAFQVFGDDLYPAVRHGTCLVVTPGADACPGELVLIEMTDRRFVVCELVSSQADAVVWTPAAGGARRTTARAEVRMLHGIVSMIPGSRLVPRSR